MWRHSRCVGGGDGGDVGGGDVSYYERLRYV